MLNFSKHEQQTINNLNEYCNDIEEIVYLHKNNNFNYDAQYLYNKLTEIINENNIDESIILYAEHLRNHLLYYINEESLIFLFINEYYKELE